MSFEDVTADLKKGMSLDEALTKHNTTLKEMFYENNPQARRTEGMAKYYYYDKLNDLFRIWKNKVYYGQYKTEAEAKLAVELFKKYGWSKDNIWRVKAEVKEELKL